MISLMKMEDIKEAIEIERVSYSSPWSIGSFVNEIVDNKSSHYLVARLEGRIVGYSGMWLTPQEAHITNLAVQPKFRRRGIGEELLVNLIKTSISKKIRWITLEVRESNLTAQKLYQKYGFQIVGVRKGYYLDNQENALIMCSEDLKTEGFKMRQSGIANRQQTSTGL
ncbi:MAG: ribosomal-protein-alanine N-acetyltransferase [Armatimonadetes bacterium CG07_land_8_20_14_0_80_40_9]|nr:MAG: ribosomal-protein-alanine N-acetyltransferase [Armatimonadetes bacterium CG07_land_8_20_14_0_80_40_9]